jgi:DNA-binding transcriptional LysR family regulator
MLAPPPGGRLGRVADLDVRLLRAFVAVAEELSFSRAAERLDMAQQGLSAQVRQLEARLDAKVFKRTTRRVALTPAGEALLPHARAVLAEVDAGVEAVRRVAASAANALAVAGLEDAGAIGPALLERFAEARPDVTISVSDDAPAHEVLDDGLGPPVAVAFVRPPFRGVNRLATVTLLTEPRLVGLPAGHALADRDSVDPSELMSESWAWVGPPDRVAEAFWLLEGERYGRAARVGGRPAGYRELLELVAEGKAVGLVPAGVAEARAPSTPGVRFVPVAGIEPSRLALAWRPSAETPAVRELAEIARALAKERA